MLKHMLLLATIFGVGLLGAPAANALEKETLLLERSISDIERQIERETSGVKQMALVETLHKKRLALEGVQRRQAAADRAVSTKPADNPHLEHQAQAFEKTREFLPHEIATIRGAGIANRPAASTEAALQEKQELDKTFSDEVVKYNTEIATLRDKLKELQEKRASSIRNYQTKVETLRQKQRLAFQPVAAPTEGLNKKSTIQRIHDAPKHVMPERPTYATTDPFDRAKIIGGGGLRKYQGTDFHAQ